MSAPTDPWLERTRLSGMVLAGFSYGIFFLLSIQSCVSIFRGLRSPRNTLRRPLAYALLFYVSFTFILGTVGIGANARYTEDIWINFRGWRTPDDLITHEFEFWENRLAIDSQYVLVWILDLLLLYRCIVIWNYMPWVVILMSSIYLSIISLSIAVMVFAGKSAVFFNLKLQIGFLAMSCAYNFLFTILVSTQLLIARKRMKDAFGDEDTSTYTSITTTLIESTAIYVVFELIFLFAFAFHSNIQNLILLENALIQAISQLLIILRVAQGREYVHTSVAMSSTTDATRSNPIVFADHMSMRFGRRDVVVELSSVTHHDHGPHSRKQEDTNEANSVLTR
ncbi:hypothetical protein BDQ12DRAFT_772932 [Crucibulum laeve]|uniref:Uncharacterized protein n=1 Tax=Crucibulum laeve TaxID=68775 RepID=A0A5C3LKY1_9AGAR|nr:hypothetical protein BDQ12DRAFT_772932 [Crucibulum laeve]